MQRKIRTVFMRGGTSGALFFRQEDLPSDPKVRARVVLDYLDPGGAVTGRLLPAGNPRDPLEVPGVGQMEVSIVEPPASCRDR